MVLVLVLEEVREDLEEAEEVGLEVLVIMEVDLEEVVKAVVLKEVEEEKGADKEEVTEVVEEPEEVNIESCL